MRYEIQTQGRRSHLSGSTHLGFFAARLTAVVLVVIINLRQGASDVGNCNAKVARLAALHVLREVHCALFAQLQ